jgi:RNA ligase (TIGR02306 family)
MPVEDLSLTVGTDVAALFGITRWEPPALIIDGEADRPHPAFHGYTDIEHYRNFPELLRDGEEVVITEKVHGKNCRLGLARTGEAWTLMAGSHNQRRKEHDCLGRRSQFWDVLAPLVEELLRHVAGSASAGVVLFGELFGAGIQDMWYGLENSRFALRAFDLAVDGKFLDYDDKVPLFDRFGIERVPILYRGPFSRAVVEEHVGGPTTMCPPEKAGKFKGREGIVITPVRERRAETATMVFDRVILKAISCDYLERKGGTEYH